MKGLSKEPVREDGSALGGQIGAPAKLGRRTKQALIPELVSEVERATLKELTSATVWLPHTARAAITGVRKRGYDVQCKRVDGVSRYWTTSGNSG